jgi:hypothetical protein
MSAEKQLVLIGGPHRSGTTLLVDLLATHPDVTGLSGTGFPMDEGQFVQDVYPATAGLRPGYVAYQSDAWLNEDSPLVNPASAARLLEQWGRYWRRDAKVLVEKSPPNMLKSRFFDALFPSALQLFVLRDPLVVAAATQKWTQTSLTAGVHHTIEAYRRLFADLPHVACKWLVVRYEALVDEPLSVLAPVLEELELSVDGLGDLSGKVDSQVNARYRDIFSAATLSPRGERALLRARRVCRRFGVEVSGLSAEVEYVRNAFAEPLRAMGYQREEHPPAVYRAHDLDALQFT